MGKTVKVPAHLSEKMRKFYKNVCKDYEFELHHLELLQRACECFDRADQARDEIQKDGLTTVDRYGSIKPHPCVKIETDQKNCARLLLRELGLDLESSSEAGRGKRLY